LQQEGRAVKNGPNKKEPLKQAGSDGGEVDEKRNTESASEETKKRGDGTRGKQEKLF